jgi:hypothetical protein
MDIGWCMTMHVVDCVLGNGRHVHCRCTKVVWGWLVAITIWKIFELITKKARSLEVHDCWMLGVALSYTVMLLVGNKGGPFWRVLERERAKLESSIAAPKLCAVPFCGMALANLWLPLEENSNSLRT